MEKKLLQATFFTEKSREMIRKNNMYLGRYIAKRDADCSKVVERKKAVVELAVARQELAK